MHLIRRAEPDRSTESDLSDVGEIAAAAAADSDSYCSSDVLPLNHVWDWEEWDEYGMWRPPPGHEEKLLKKQGGCLGHVSKMFGSKACLRCVSVF